MQSLKKIIVTMLLTIFTASFSHAALVDSCSFDPVPIPITSVSLGGVPVGTVVAWPLTALPTEKDKYGNPKWLECNGQTVNATVYPELPSFLSF